MEVGGKAVWEDSPEKREASLRERKAKMILAARQYVIFCLLFRPFGFLFPDYSFVVVSLAWNLSLLFVLSFIIYSHRVHQASIGPGEGKTAIVILITVLPLVSADYLPTFVADYLALAIHLNRGVYRQTSYTVTII